MKFRGWTSARLAGCIVASCGGDATSDGGTVDAAHDGNVDDAHPDVATVDGGSNDASADVALTCNTLVNTAPLITGQLVPANPPTPNGGVISDGTYFVTAGLLYTGDGGKSGSSNTSGKEMLVLEAGTAQIVVTHDAGETVGTVVVTTSGTNMTWSIVCPEGAPVDGGITFAYGTDDAGSFTYYFGSLDSGGVYANVLTKQ